MLSKSVLFCILARDCGNQFKKNIDIFENWRRYFVKSSVVVVENGSIDNTQEVVDDYARQYSGVYALHPEINDKDRIERLVNCRNTYLDYAKETGPWDYIIVIDGDLLLKPVNLEDIISRAPSDWVGLFANGRSYCKLFGLKIPRKYYDGFALVPENSGTIHVSFNANAKNAKKLKTRKEYTRYSSAFAGVGIYRYRAIEDKRYELVKNECGDYPYICEHIPFNLGLGDTGSLYICKKLRLLSTQITIIYAVRKIVGTFKKVKA